MLTDACQWFYRCDGCGATLRPRSGLLRVLLDQRCPPKQAGQSSA